jgi:hypothetical protein
MKPARSARYGVAPTPRGAGTAPPSAGQVPILPCVPGDICWSHLKDTFAAGSREEKEFAVNAIRSGRGS